MGMGQIIWAYRTELKWCDWSLTLNEKIKNRNQKVVQIGMSKFDVRTIETRVRWFVYGVHKYDADCSRALYVDGKIARILELVHLRIHLLGCITGKAEACWCDTGLSTAQCVHSNSGTAVTYHGRFLADVVGTQLDHCRHADQAPRDGPGRYISQSPIDFIYNFAFTVLIKPNRIRDMRTIVIDNPGVCQSVYLSHWRAVRKRLNGPMSCLGWRLLGPIARNIVLDGWSWFLMHGKVEGVRCGLCQITLAACCCCIFIVTTVLYDLCEFGCRRSVTNTGLLNALLAISTLLSTQLQNTICHSTYYASSKSPTLGLVVL